MEKQASSGNLVKAKSQEQVLFCGLQFDVKEVLVYLDLNILTSVLLKLYSLLVSMLDQQHPRPIVMCWMTDQGFLKRAQDFKNPKFQASHTPEPEFIIYMMRRQDSHRKTIGSTAEW